MRRVWVAKIPNYEVTVSEVMIEFFDEENIVNVAFRPAPQATWGPPIQAEER